MTRKPPLRWRDEVSMDTKIASIEGVQSTENVDIPDRINTVGELLRSVHSLNLVETQSVAEKPVRHMLSMKYERCDIPEISDKARFQIALFLSATGFTQAYNFDSEQCESNVSFDNIMCATCHQNVRSISCKPNHSPAVTVNPSEQVKSVAYIEHNRDTNRYVIMDEDVNDTSILFTGGISDDTEYTVLNVLYPEQFKTLFNHNSHRDLFDNTRFAHDMPAIIESSGSTASGIIAPLKDGTDYTKPWSKIDCSFCNLIY